MLPVKVHFSFGENVPDGGSHELFSLLEAVRTGGSIGAAARLLGCSYRHLWGRLKSWEAQLGRPLIRWDKGRAACLSPFGDKLLWADARIKARLAPAIDNLVADIERELSVAYDDALPIITCVASHDLALNALRSDTLESRSMILDLRFAASLQALQALRAGECLFAGIHLPVDHPELSGRGSLMHRTFGAMLRRGREKMIRVCGRRQGWMRAGTGSSDAPTRDFNRLGDGSVITREPGSGTRTLFDQLAHQAGRDPQALIARTESSHLAVAAAVAAGDAETGFGIEAAAHRYGLQFEPLVREQYFLVCHRDTIDSDQGRAVIQALGAASWQEQVKRLPGYDLEGTGEIVSLRRVLPWYQQRSSRRG